MIIPDEKNLALQNCVGTAIIFSILYAMSYALKAHGFNSVDIVLGVFVLFLVSILLINRFARSTAEMAAFQKYSKLSSITVGGLLVVGLLYQSLFSSSKSTSAVGRLFINTSQSSQHIESHASLSLVPSAVSSLAATTSLNSVCIDSLSKGKWMSTDCSKLPKNAALCRTSTWVWDKSSCSIGILSQQKIQKLFANKKVCICMIISLFFHNFLLHFIPAMLISDCILWRFDGSERIPCSQ
jgi:hypothetical protein